MKMKQLHTLYHTPEQKVKKGDEEERKRKNTHIGHHIRFFFLSFLFFFFLSSFNSSLSQSISQNPPVVLRAFAVQVSDAVEKLTLYRCS
jgi:hypothetical protein